MLRPETCPDHRCFWLLRWSTRPTRTRRLPPPGQRCSDRRPRAIPPGGQHRRWRHRIDDFGKSELWSPPSPVWASRPGALRDDQVNTRSRVSPRRAAPPARAATSIVMLALHEIRWRRPERSTGCHGRRPHPATAEPWRDVQPTGRGRTPPVGTAGDAIANQQVVDERCDALRSPRACWASIPPCSAPMYLAQQHVDLQWLLPPVCSSIQVSSLSSRLVCYVRRHRGSRTARIYTAATTSRQAGTRILETQHRAARRLGSALHDKSY